MKIGTALSSDSSKISQHASLSTNTKNCYTDYRTAGLWKSQSTNSSTSTVYSTFCSISIIKRRLKIKQHDKRYMKLISHVVQSRYHSPWLMCTSPHDIICNQDAHYSEVTGFYNEIPFPDYCNISICFVSLTS